MRTTITMLSIIAILISGNVACQAQGSQRQEDPTTQKLQVYYFHFTRRCNTCRAVESNSQHALETLYPEKYKSGEYTFTALNLDEENGRAMAEKYGVSGQTLLIVWKNQKTDLTDKGFLYAHNPEKLKDELAKAIQQLMNP